MQHNRKDVFRITEEEENTFDTQHSPHIEAYIQVHHNRIKAYDNVDLTRLDDATFYTRQITTDEVKNKSIWKYNPWEFKNKQISPLKLPKQCHNCINYFFNDCFASGLFPTAMKKALIRFIPKENKSPKSPINYRPIYLLETPGKIFEKKYF